MKKNTKIMEAAAIIITFLATILFFYIACTTEVKSVSGGIKSMDFPKVILGLQIVLLGILTVKDIFLRKCEKEDPQEKLPLVEKR